MMDRRRLWSSSRYTKKYGLDGDGDCLFAESKNVDCTRGAKHPYWQYWAQHCLHSKVFLTTILLATETIYEASLKNLHLLYYFDPLKEL